MIRCIEDQLLTYDEVFRNEEAEFPTVGLYLSDIRNQIVFTDYDILDLVKHQFGLIIGFLV